MAATPSNWNAARSRSANSACDTANGGCTITLSEDFVMGSYSGKIEFSGKAITFWGQGNVLDASGGGRLFQGVGAGSFLELHDAVLQNGNAVNVSGWSASRHCVLELLWEPPLTFRSNSCYLCCIHQQLLGRCYFCCRQRERGDPRLHLPEQHH
jgi:hypothetical protein